MRRANPFRIVNGDVRTFRIALKVPFITAAGRKDATTNACVRLRLAGGAEGYGEASGSVVHASLTAGRLAGALRAQTRRAVGRDVRDFADLSAACWARPRAPAPAAAAFECALLGALTRQLGISMTEWFGGALKTLETDVTLSADSPARTRAAAAAAAADGFRIFKVKVGTGERADWDRIRACWDSVVGSARPPRLILDGNQGLTPAAASRLAARCAASGIRIALLEQPLPRGRLDDSAELRRSLGAARRPPLPLAADEDVRSPEEALAVLDAGAADVLNVKAAKTGILPSLRIIALARAAGARLMIGCMQESARGLSASVHLALGTGAFDFVDLDSDHLLVADQPRGDFIRDGPVLTLR